MTKARKVTKNEADPIHESQARILVVDNDIEVLRQVKEILGSRYIVSTVWGEGRSLMRKAKREAAKLRPHVAIVDLRLNDDYDTSDISGLNLLKSLIKNSELLKLIVYSAYLNPSIDREIMKLGATWVSKAGHVDELKQAVDHYVMGASANHRSFHIRWPDNWNLPQIIEKTLAAPVPNSLIADIILGLFEQYPSVGIEHVTGRIVNQPSPVSHGHSLVVKAHPANTQVPKILKITEAKRIIAERENYHRYVQDQLPGVFHTQLERSCLHWDVGGAVYTFLGDTQKRALSTFADFYRSTAAPEAILAPIRHFCQETWSHHYRQKRWIDANRPLFDLYDATLQLGKKLDRSSEDKSLKTLSISTHLLDPVEWVRKYRNSSRGTTEAVVHADFHGSNLFTNGDYLWVIDFERTGPCHALFDFCELEVDIVTRLLPTQIGHAQFLQLVIELAKVDGEVNKLNLTDPLTNDMNKAAVVIQGLRTLAQEVTGYQDPSEYVWGLIYDLVFVVLRSDKRREGEDSDDKAAFMALQQQRQRAWIYASVLCERLQNKGKPWPTDVVDAALNELQSTSNVANTTTFVELVHELGIAPSTEALEQVLSTANILFDSSQLRQRLAQIEQQVCRVEIDGAAKGTGFLIGPSAVMTCHHVVRSLLNNKVQPQSVRFRFDYKLLDDGTTINSGMIYQLAPEWLIDSSPHSQVDGQAEPKTNLPKPEELDYVVLRVKGTPGQNSLLKGPLPGDTAERGYIRLPVDQEGEGSPPSKALFMVQHPDGNPQKITVNAFRSFNANFTRVTYLNDSKHGSSGAPCFDGNLSLFALHHSGDPAKAHPQFNEGIPIAAIIRLLRQRNKLPLIAPEYS